MSKNIKPLGEYVLIGVSENKNGEKTASGIFVPPVANMNKNSGNLRRGKILVIPSGDEGSCKYIKHLAVGQIVLYPEWAAHIIPEVSGTKDSAYDYKEVVLVKCEEIRAIVEGTDV